MYCACMISDESCRGNIIITSLCSCAHHDIVKHRWKSSSFEYVQASHPQTYTTVPRKSYILKQRMSYKTPNLRHDIHLSARETVCLKSAYVSRRVACSCYTVHTWWRVAVRWFHRHMLAYCRPVRVLVALQGLISQFHTLLHVRSYLQWSFCQNLVIIIFYAFILYIYSFVDNKNK